MPPGSGSWQWTAEIELGGQRYPVTYLPSPTPEFEQTAIVLGLPAPHRDRMLVAAQSSPTPHAWKLDRVREASEVGPEVLERARQLFVRDIEQYDNVFLTFLGIRADGDHELFGCAAARRKPDPHYESQGWVVLGRLLALPQVRGRGFGNHFTLAFFSCSQTLCGPPAVGCFLPTDTEQTRRLCRRAVQHGALNMVPAGRKRWRMPDGYFEVEVFMAFYPGTRQWLFDATAAARRDIAGSARLEALLDAVDVAWREGYDADGGVRLGSLYEEVEAELTRVSESVPGARLYADFLAAARANGTFAVST